MELATPGSAVSFASVTRHVTDCATRPGKLSMRLYFISIKISCAAGSYFALPFTLYDQCSWVTSTFSQLRGHYFCLPCTHLIIFDRIHNDVGKCIKLHFVCATCLHDILVMNFRWYLCKIWYMNSTLGQNFFISWFTNPPTVIFRKVGKKQVGCF